MDVVLGAGWPGVMLHEAVGHGLEGDFNRKQTSAFAGLMGQQVAAKGVTVVDDGTMASRRGSLSIDDEGTPTNRTVLIEDGILVGYMQDRQNARLMNMKPTGNGRRQDYAHVPMPRMTNTYMLAGSRDPAEILASVKNGIYAANFGGGQVDITSGKYVFQCTEAYKIENGKVGAPLKGAMLIGNGPTDLHRITMIGNDLALDTGIGTCGKNGQGVPVGVGQPTLRMERITVGGTGSMSTETETAAPKAHGWRGQLLQLAAIVLAVFLAKGAFAEPFYVPSGSMEPTLLIGDALLASKYPYGYSAASLPIQITLPETGRVFGGMPKRGDVVVFRWPGDRSQAWVKRVVGLPGDRIQMRQGQLFINDHAGVAETRRHRTGGRRQWRGRARLSLHRDLAGRRFARDFQASRQRPARQHGRSDGAAGPAVRDGRQPRQLRRQPGPGAPGRRRTACRSTTWSAAPTPWSDHGTSESAASRSGHGCPAFASRGSSPR